MYRMPDTPFCQTSLRSKRLDYIRAAMEIQRGGAEDRSVCKVKAVHMCNSLDGDRTWLLLTEDIFLDYLKWASRDGKGSSRI